MYEITYLVFIRYRGPFGISIPLPRLRTAHVDRPLPLFHSFDLAEVLSPEKEEKTDVPDYLRFRTPIPSYQH